MQRKAAEAIEDEMGKLGENVIVDTHCAIRSPAGFLPGLPFEVLQKLSPDAIVLREVDPASIVERRNKDRESGVRSKRDEEEISEIQLHQDINRSYATAYSAVSGATLTLAVDKKVEDFEFENAALVARAVMDIFQFR